MGDILLLLILLAITYTTGCIIEKNHYNKIKKREIALFRQPHVTFESVLDRGRREAILRMREKARYANFIINTRIESVMLNDVYGKESVPQCAIIAYGTAVTYEK